MKKPFKIRKLRPVTKKIVLPSDEEMHIKVEDIIKNTASRTDATEEIVNYIKFLVKRK